MSPAAVRARCRHPLIFIKRNAVSKSCKALIKSARVLPAGSYKKAELGMGSTKNLRIRAPTVPKAADNTLRALKNKLFLATTGHESC